MPHLRLTFYFVVVEAVDDFEADEVVVCFFVVGERAKGSVEGVGNVGFSWRAEQKCPFEDYLIEILEKVF